MIEINASNRSESKLRERVADSTSMAAAFGDKRPHCLILDEIDGAMGGAQGKGAINALVEIIKGGDKQDRAARAVAEGEDDAAGGGGGVSRKKKQPSC